MSKKNVLDKIMPMGTLQRRLHKKEIEDMNNESQKAINRLNIQSLTLDPDYYDLKEDDEMSTLGLGEKKKLEPLLKLLIDWINNELAEKRVIVKDLQEDLYDGHILQLIMEKLTGSTISESKLNLGEIAQKQNLRNIIDFINKSLNIHPLMCKWRVEKIYDKDLISILHLLIAIIKHFKVPLKLPDNVSVNVIVVKKSKILEKKTITEQLTENESNNFKRERDAFDTLFDHAPDKLNLVKNSLLTFLKKHLSKVKIEVNDIDRQLSDGVYLIILMGILEDYYVPDYSYYPNANTFEEKVENVSLLFELMDDAGLPDNGSKPDDIVNSDLKATMRIVYNLFSKYKDKD